MDIVVLAKKRSSKGGGSKKYDRNRKKCERYRLAGRREKNKARKIAKEDRRLLRLAQYKADILAGKKPETSTHKRSAR